MDKKREQYVIYHSLRNLIRSMEEVRKKYGLTGGNPLYVDAALLAEKYAPKLSKGEEG